VKRSPSVAVRGVVAVLLAGCLAGCSMFQGDSTERTPIPSAVTSTTVPSVSGASLASTTTAPSNAPTPPTVPGYALSASSPAVQRKFETVAGQFTGVFSGLTVRTVTKGQQAAGTLVLLGLHPELIGNKAVEQRLVPGMLKGMSGQGAKVATQTVSGQEIAVATTKTTSILGWYSRGVVAMVLGNGADPAPSLAFVQAYLAVK
jgi:hypothetical protein